MNIQELKEKCNLFLENLRGLLPQRESASRYYTAVVIILVGLSSFGLGRLSVLDERREPVIVESGGETDASSTPTSAVGVEKSQTASVVKSFGAGELAAAGGRLVASRNGTKYYFPWCGGAAKIADTNKIWFNSEAEAKAKGYSAAGNCRGLK